MSQRIRTFERLLGEDGKTYIPKAYAELNTEGSWSAYLAFFPVSGPIIATDHQITEPTVGRVIEWADTLTIDDLHDALARAKILSRTSTLAAEVARLAFLEREALGDAEALEDEAERDTAAAEVARDDAEIFRRDRLQTEAAAADWEEKMANASAAEHERAARNARASATNAKARKKASKAATKRSSSKR